MACDTQQTLPAGCCRFSHGAEYTAPNSLGARRRTSEPERGSRSWTRSPCTLVRSVGLVSSPPHVARRRRSLNLRATRQSGPRSQLDLVRLDERPHALRAALALAGLAPMLADERLILQNRARYSAAPRVASQLVKTRSAARRAGYRFDLRARDTQPARVLLLNHRAHILSTLRTGSAFEVYSLRRGPCAALAFALATGTRAALAHAFLCYGEQEDTNVTTTRISTMVAERWVASAGTCAAT